MRKLQGSLFLLVAVFFLSSCAPCVDCGSLVLKHSVTRTFSSAVINPDYRYYYSGNDGEPDAIMGLKKEYTLTGGYWREVTLTEEHLAWWMESIETSRSLYVNDANGFEILTPDGSLAGIYYSRLEWLVVKFPEPGTISVTTPAPLPWKRDWDDDERGTGDYLRR